MNPQQWKIRAAQEVDIDGLFPIVVEFATSFVPQRTAFQRAFQRLQGDDHACVLVADHGGGPIGYLLGFEHLTFFANGPVAWVEEVAVHSSWRRKGVGRALMAQFVVLTYRDETVWEGVVEVFGLKGHPKAGLGYAWSQETDGGGRRYVAILGMPPIESAADAVQVFLASEQP